MHKKDFTHSFSLNLMMAAILNSTILDWAILVFPLNLTPTCQDWFPPFAQKTFTHSFWLNLMMAAILNSTMLDSDTAMLDSDTFLSSLRFTQKQSPSTLNQTNSIWLTWWWLPSWILPILDSAILHTPLSQTNSIWLKLIHSDSTWWWQPSWIPAILNLAILDSATLVFPLKLTSTLAKIGSHHLHKKDFTHTSLPTICTKKTSLIHSDSTWWWQPSWILPCWIKKLHSFILTQLDDGSHLEFCHVGFRHLVFFSQIHS